MNSLNKWPESPWFGQAIIMHIFNVVCHGMDNYVKKVKIGKVFIRKYFYEEINSLEYDECVFLLFSF